MSSATTPPRPPTVIRAGRRGDRSTGPRATLPHAPRLVSNLRRIGLRFAATALLLAGCAEPHTTRPVDAVPPPPADLIVSKARIWSPGAPEAEALAVRDGRFVAVGTANDIEPFAGPATERIDAQGRRIIPGLIDAHVHPISGGLALANLALRDVRDYDEFLRRVRDEAARRRSAGGDWLIGRGWSTESWPDRRPLRREDVDVPGGMNVLLYRMDGHCALANTAALTAAGLIDSDVPDPPGGLIERDPATGRPTGILKDAAMDLVARLVPPPTPDRQRDALRAAMREANRFGVTTIHAMSPWSDLEIMQRVHDEGRDTLRIAVYIMEPNWLEFVPRVRAFPVRDDRLWIAGFKAYMDGSLGSRTAYMHDEYADRPDERGLLMDVMQPPSRMAANLRAADRAGLQCAVHAIGDEANRLLLNFYDDLARNNGPRDRRPRIEHAQHLLPEDVSRFARLGVIPSMQPFHKADDARYAEQALGEMRCRTSYAFADLARGGAVLAFGSDWPVVTIDPFAGIHAAVTGRTLDGRTWMTQQNVTVAEALTAYTAGAAYACFREDRLGRIAPGDLADFVLLDRDPLALTAEDLAAVRPAATFVGGRRVWPRD